MSMNNIHIYNAYTCERLHVIQHPQSSIIKKLKYVKDELHCITRSNKFYLYNMMAEYTQTLTFSPKEHLSSSQKEANFDVIEYDSEFDVFVTARPNEIQFFTGKETCELLSHHMNSKITCIEICKPLKTMFLGTEAGEVLSFTWPNNPRRLELEFPKVMLHESAVSMIKVSNNLTSITSASIKGSLIQSRLRMIENLQEIHSTDIAYENKGIVSVSRFLSNSGIVLHSQGQRVKI
jgi:hypothetical protein